jgi:chromosome segregation ATPase
LKTALSAAQESLAHAQAEVEEMGKQLAEEKMERMTALAELDAAKSMKPDTSAADALRDQLAAVQRDHELSTATAAADAKKLHGELEELKVKLGAAEEKHADLQGDLDLAQKTIEAHRDEADAKHKTAQADYQDLNDSMTALVEEANNRAKMLEAQLDEITSKSRDGAKKIEELEAQLKVKDAEIAEAKAST